jgi:hypothetical protein
MKVDTRLFPGINMVEGTRSRPPSTCELVEAPLVAHVFININPLDVWLLLPRRSLNQDKLLCSLFVRPPGNSNHAILKTLLFAGAKNTDIYMCIKELIQQAI